MALDCLDNYITLRGVCDETTPVSGMYINDVAGVDLKMLSNIASQEQQSLKGVWDEIVTRSKIEIESDVLIKMQKYFKTNILLENLLVGEYNSENTIETTSNYKKGIVIDLFGSKNSEIFINSIQLYSDTALTTDIKLYDVNNGNLLYTISSTLVVGFNTIQINKLIDVYGQRKRIFIAYDGNVLSSLQSSLWGGSDCGCSHNFSSGYYASVTGAKVLNTQTNLVYNNLTTSGESYGMTVNFNVVCSIKNFICSNRDFLKTAYLYKLAYNVFVERLSSDRLNKYTMFNAEKAKEMRDEYSEKYSNVLDAVLNNLMPANDGICFSCNKGVNYKYNMP